MTQAVTIDVRDIEITPFFKYIEVENVPQSEIAGRMVMRQVEAVELHFAGRDKYRPIFPVTAQASKKGHNVITYAERFPEQYRAFKEGGAQVAEGTPLHLLSDYGITPAQMSFCRALKIYSIEALDSIDGRATSSLGIHQNKLKEAARRYLADNAKGGLALSEIEALRAEIAALKAGNVVESFDKIDSAEVEAQALDEYLDVTDEELKERIKEACGHRPKGNPSRATLVAQLKELES